MNRKARRAEKFAHKTGRAVERGFGPRHAFNAQEGDELVPEPLPSPPQEELEFKRNSFGNLRPAMLAKALREELGSLTKEDVAKLGISLLIGGEGPREPSLPPSAKPKQPGLKFHDPAPRYEGPPEAVKEPFSGFNEQQMQEALKQAGKLGGKEQEAFWSMFWKKHHNPEMPAEDLMKSQSDPQFPSLNKPPYDALKEPPLKIGDQPKGQEIDAWNKAFNKYAHSEPLTPEEAQLLHKWESVSSEPSKYLRDFLKKEHGLGEKDLPQSYAEKEAEQQSKKTPKTPYEKAADERSYGDPHLDPDELPPEQKYTHWLGEPVPKEPSSDISHLKGQDWLDAYMKKLDEAGLVKPGPQELQDAIDALDMPSAKPPDEPPFEPNVPRFKKGSKGVRHTPKTKTGRPKKIGVDRGFGPRHAANTKEGEDLTTINTDTVPAMLTPREAVLNRNAAELAGRDDIEALNAEGNQLAQQGIDLAGKDKDMKPKQSKPKSQSGSPYVQGFEAQKAKGYEGGVAKLPKPAESVGGLGTPAGYTNTNKWGNSFGWNPGTPPQLGGGAPNPWGNGPFNEPPRGTQNVNQYGVAYGWNPGGVEKPYPMPVQGAPGGWMPQPNPIQSQPLKSGGLYPPGQGIFHGATGASDITQIGEPNPQQAYGAPIQLSAPDISKLIQQEGQKQGLNPNQIAALTKAFSSFGGGGGYGEGSATSQALGPALEAANIPEYQGGISEVGYPPGIAPNAVFSYDEGGWTGPLDPRWSSPGYQGGTSGVPGLYRGENDFRGGGPSGRITGGQDFTGHVHNPNLFPPDFPAADWQEPQIQNISQFRGAAGFPWSPTMIPTTYNPQGYPRAVPAGPDWNRSGPPPHTPRKYKS